METKHVTTRATLKADGDEGAIEAQFSMFNVIDRDGDVVEAGAIEDGKSVPMVWSHDWSRMIGKGVTHVDAERAVFKGSLFLNTAAGRDAYETLRAMDELIQFSWGFRVVDADWAERDGQQVRVIKRTEIFEVSPVLVGANQHTQLLSLKRGLPLIDHAETLDAAVADFVSRVRGRADYRAKEGRTLSTANRERLAAIATSLAGAAGDLNAILKETEPAKSLDIDALLLDYLAVAAKANGVNL